MTVFDGKGVVFFALVVFFNQIGKRKSSAIGKLNFCVRGKTAKIALAVDERVA